EKDDIVLESVDKKTLPALSQISHHNRDSTHLPEKCEGEFGKEDDGRELRSKQMPLPFYAYLPSFLYSSSS
ncbi:hypothetical protein Gogos_008088, partial [Gossypium gossypioides]|nr:hypothetical protein [Gossypium gossypioides]